MIKRKTNKFVSVGSYWARAEGSEIVIRTSRTSRGNVIGSVSRADANFVNKLVTFASGGTVRTEEFPVIINPFNTIKIGCTAVSFDLVRELFRQLQ
jgi:hypothetical protein